MQIVLELEQINLLSSVPWDSFIQNQKENMNQFRANEKSSFSSTMILV